MGYVNQNHNIILVGDGTLVSHAASAVQESEKSSLLWGSLGSG